MGKSIWREIEQKRLEMISVGLTKGFTDRMTVEISQELDRLLNKISHSASSFEKNYYYTNKI
ncbi:aspartyl-phosphate phosphatase Spo0E family protein [Bacillus sp. 31A1R]|uniref:Aspartyl-phosphate phosphatase Spo0E family protein n=1 Tax=Robertmurraya mangrovi TaxID=3098077 RepID=A0ABU5IYE8_9BACI|nr:aspartyl-phosphate phosphatase Spo0E family protein [Bacillus sp. 31A1R]MDZ5472190.1 aspartyl-phosphate phosphatase Spo0E family protein [Bacillus sp. 31A1R]